jgi:hypothetical protein
MRKMYDEKLVESNARRMLNAFQKRKEIRYRLEHEDLAPLVRQAMEKDVERANYDIKVGAEFRKAYREYLSEQAQTEKQPVTAPKPQAEVPNTIEARVVA